jgi:hypothetical protein
MNLLQTARALQIAETAVQQVLQRYLANDGENPLLAQPSSRYLLLVKTENRLAYRELQGEPFQQNPGESTAKREPR